MLMIMNMMMKMMQNAGEVEDRGSAANTTNTQLYPCHFYEEDHDDNVGDDDGDGDYGVNDDDDDCMCSSI